ncbi:MAG TPA: ABC transporter ATP-binding protein [Rectinemataceae bacterium]|nr:ABC transporter ATP-binding protein [Rectinemataceae bacterium]
MSAQHLVETKDLATNFYTFEGMVRALNNVSLVVDQGETYGIVGESGCGKSVTVRSMMRIVQAPGRIDGGKIVMFLNAEDKNKGIEILGRTEAYMASIRGKDVSMIFQEPGAALNPVLSIHQQIAESYEFHRMDEMLEKSIESLEAQVKERGGGRPGLWTGIKLSMLKRELKSHKEYSQRIQTIDNELYKLEDSTDPASLGRKHELNHERDKPVRGDAFVGFVRRVPFLRRYRRALDKTVEAQVIDLLRSLGIPNPENIAKRYPHELSGGMQQRIVIAIALACHPTLLIADEPTSNLDVTIQAQIVDLIRELKKTAISSVVFITHDLGIVAEICDRVTVMYAGDVAETATVKELFRNPLHPYAQGLLDAVPKEVQEGELTIIPGAVPNLIRPPSGCRFHPRCKHKMAICEQEKPATLEIGPGHLVACHLYTKDQSK